MFLITTVCIIDDGVDYTHPDIKANFRADLSYDFNDHVPNCTPKNADDIHGTKCAGQIMAARNDACGVGIAWDAQVSGLRILSGPLSRADEADMTKNSMF